MFNDGCCLCSTGDMQQMLDIQFVVDTSLANKKLSERRSSSGRNSEVAKNWVKCC